MATATRKTKKEQKIEQIRNSLRSASYMAGIELVPVIMPAEQGEGGHFAIRYRLPDNENYEVAEFDKLDEFAGYVGGIVRMAWILHEKQRQLQWHKCGSCNAEFRSKDWDKHIEESNHYSCNNVSEERALELELAAVKGARAQ